MITYVSGDIRKTDARYIAHGCNAQGVMGSGVAKALRTKWPEIFESYKKHLQKYRLGSTHDAIGTVDISTSLDGTKVIGNLITQEYYGRDGQRYATPSAIYWSLGTLISHAVAERKGRVTIAIPKIGCGLGGLDWDSDVRRVVQKLSDDWGVDFLVYTL